METVSHIPPCMHTITPLVVCRGALRAIEFYKSAFGAKEVRAPILTPDGRVLHATLELGDSRLFVADEFVEWNCLAPSSLNGSPVTLHLYVPEVDSFVEHALAAGATLVMPVQDTFWGDRYGKLADPFGHQWSVATRIREVKAAEVADAARAMFTA